MQTQHQHHYETQAQSTPQDSPMASKRHTDQNIRTQAVISRNRHSSCYRPHKEVEAQGSLYTNGKIVQLRRVQDPRKDRHFTADHPVRNTHENEVSRITKIQDLWFSTTIINTYNGVLRRALGRFHCTRRRPNSDNTKIL
jgi:hypothetical protein